MDRLLVIMQQIRIHIRRILHDIRIRRMRILAGSVTSLTPVHTLCIQFSAKRAANVVDLKCGRTSAYAVFSTSV